MDRIENEFNIQFSDEFREFQLNECHKTPIGDFAFDNYGWANNELGPMENLSSIVADAQSIGVTRDFAPFKCDNGDYYCIDSSSRVVIWDHNGNGPDDDPGYIWTSFTKWLESTFDEG